MTDTTEPQSPAAAIDFTLAEVTAADWLNRGELHYAAAARQHTSGAVPIEYTAQEIALGRLAIEIAAGVQLAVQDTAAGDPRAHWFRMATDHYTAAVPLHVGGGHSNEYVAQEIALAMLALERSAAI